MKHLLFFLLPIMMGLFLSPEPPNDIDLSGQWTGKIHKQGNEDYYLYSMNLEHISKSVYEGKSLIQYKDEEWHTKKKLLGNWAGKFCYNEEKFLVHHHELGAYWLMIRGCLMYDPKEDKLYGHVDAYDPYMKSVSKNHDYVELYRQKEKLVYHIPALPTPYCE